MFSKILIANRGEIACRIIRTAKRLGVKTVAVYSDADRRAQHVQMADEAVRIGLAPATESYLVQEQVIQAALETGAEAIHPGYGFLSENPEFVRAVEKAGLVFIGPSAESIRAMGLKDAAKRLMQEAGVPVVPGYHGESQEVAFLRDQAAQIGFPVLIKAAAGGGGKGMRQLETLEEFDTSLESCRNEARAAFGDDRILIEKLVANPRHIEVQIFADSHGNTVHLFERDCSLQRRHQKVIEEAPAPGISDEVRVAMTSAAIRAAEAVNYTGAGTVEFIADGSDALRADGFWFMEMNTRLQVEHPVTEAITGYDLVEWQLRVAAGETLPARQDEIAIRGHAIEARLYAEDPDHGFLPQAGKIEHLDFPEGDGIRIDSGVVSKDEVSPFYDPMIAKLVGHGTSRDQAISTLSGALDQTQVSGLTTNRDFLRALLENDEFRSGEMDTGLIARDLKGLLEKPPLREEAILLTALSLDGVDPAGDFAGFRHWGQPSHRISLVYGGDKIDRRYSLGAGWAEISGDRETLRLTELTNDDGVWNASLQRDQRELAICAKIYVWEDVPDTRIQINIDGTISEFMRPDPLALSGSEGDGSGDIVAPMTGIVRQIYIKTGDQVKKGDRLVVIEAMKMEHSLTATMDGVVEAVLCETDGQVSGGAPLVKLIEEPQ